MEYQTEDLGDLFMRSMLHDSGVEVKLYHTKSY